MPITTTNAPAWWCGSHLLTGQNVNKRLAILNKPLLQFHTQFNASLPWDSVDMDFMNLNQTAHGGRSRLARRAYASTACRGEATGRTAGTKTHWLLDASGGLQAESRHLKVVRYGDNMREVAVTEVINGRAITFAFSVDAGR
ncbi:hypothetical protein ACNKHS_00435 [Shigella flexneri]